MKNELDKDTQEILEEMKADVEDTSDEESTEDEDASEEEEEVEENSEEESSEDKEEDVSSEDETTDSEDDEEEKEEESPYQEPTMTVAKHQKKKKILDDKIGERDERIKALEDEVSKYKSKVSNPRIKQLAENYGFDEKFVSEVVDVVKDSVPDMSEDIKAFKQKQEQLNQSSMYEEDFDKNISPVMKESYPDITSAKTNAIKAELRKLKFTKELANVPLDYIFTKHKAKFDSIVNPKIKKTAEKSKAGSGGRGKTIDYSNIDSDDIKGMSDKDFDKYSEAMAGKQNRFKIVSN